MTDAPQKQILRSTHQSIRVLLVIVLAISLTGFFVGLRQSRQASQKEAAYGRELMVDEDAAEVPIAVEYSHRPAPKLGVNKAWRSDLTALKQPAAPPPPKEPASASALAALLKGRESRRAFDGAPPIIPHPTMQLGVAACLACHQQGMIIGDKAAAKMSHPLYTNCTQCHVEVSKYDTKEFASSTFKPLRPEGAQTAFVGAPPALPHQAWMRNDCQSCHGVTGPAALRTTHPERQNCLQCHALTQQLDLLPPADVRITMKSNGPAAGSPGQEKK